MVTGLTTFDAERKMLLDAGYGDPAIEYYLGKKGRTAQAMRTILSCASAKQQKRVILEIVE